MPPAPPAFDGPEAPGQRARDVATVPAAVRRIYAIRAARIAFGAVLTLGGAIVLLGSVGTPPTFSWSGLWQKGGGTMAKVVLATWTAAIVAAIGAAVAARRAFQRALEGATSPRAAAVDLADRLEMPSLALPLAGLALALPQAILLAFCLRGPEYFDALAFFLALLSGASFSLLALLGVRFAHKVRRNPPILEGHVFTGAMSLVAAGFGGVPIAWLWWQSLPVAALGAIPFATLAGWAPIAYWRLGRRALLERHSLMWNRRQ